MTTGSYCSPIEIQRVKHYANSFQLLKTDILNINSSKSLPRMVSRMSVLKGAKRHKAEGSCASLERQVEKYVLLLIILINNTCITPGLRNPISTKFLHETLYKLRRLL